MLVNRSPVMVLWAACLAHLDGYTWAEALSLGSAAASQMARAKGSSLGLYSTSAPPQRQHAHALGELDVGLLGCLVPALRSEAKGVRGLAPKYSGAGELEVAPPCHSAPLAAQGLRCALRCRARGDGRARPRVVARPAARAQRPPWP